MDINKGFYTVNGKHFYQKHTALLAASINKATVEWNFNKEVFAEQCTKPRLNVSLLELYKQRAQHLRDKYKYLILAFSGGADSDTMLHAFLDNKIKIDEIWFDQPTAFIEKSGYVLTNSTENWNLPSEWYYVAKPKLEAISISHPEIKIHISDPCKNCELEDEEDSPFLAGVLSGYHVIKRWRYINTYATRLKDIHNTVAIVCGIDKCIPWYNSNHYGFVFTDCATFHKNDNVEYFYWTPDMPEIPVEQAHRVWDYLKQNLKWLNAKTVLHSANPATWIYDRKINFDSVVNAITYPTWDANTHQVNKQTFFNVEGFKRYTDYFKEEKFYQSWKTNTREHLLKLDPSICFHIVDKNTVEVNKFRNIHLLGSFL